MERGPMVGMRGADAGVRRAAALLALAGLLGGLTAAAGTAAAFEPDGNGATLGSEDTETLPVDVVVRVVNGTTRESGKAETVTLREMGPTAQAVATARDVTGETVLSRLYLDETRTYVVEAVSGGIPYYARTTGHDLAAGPVTVYTFDTTAERAGLAVSELNINIRRAETDLRLEYLVAIVNEASPQRTVLPDPTSFELLLPDGAVGAECEVLSGAAPLRVAPVAGVNPSRYGLAIPLRSGTTRLRLTTSLPYDGRARLALEASLPIRRLVLNVIPADLRVDGDFEDDASVEAVPGWRRLVGPELAADSGIDWTVSGGSAPRIATGTDGGDAVAQPGGDGPVRSTGTGMSLVGWLVVIVALLMVALALVYGWRRGGADLDSTTPDDAPRPRRRRRSG